MKINIAAWVVTFVCLLSPARPAFADSDPADLSNDGILRSPSILAPLGGDRSAQSSGKSRPWTVEVWSRGRQTYKHFPSFGDTLQTDAALHSTRVKGSESYIGERGRAQPQYTTKDNQAPSKPSLPSGQDNISGNQSSYNSSSSRLNNSVSSNGWTRKPDKFVNYPQVDQTGGRHFGNGRHYDLKAISIDQALTMAAAADEILKPAEDGRSKKSWQDQVDSNNYP